MKSYLGKGIYHIMLLAAFLTLVTNSFGQQITALSADEAVETAMKNIVDVKNALLDVQIQRQTNRGITAAALPQVNGNVNYTNYLNIPTSLLPAEFFGGQPGQYVPIRFGLKHNVNYGIDLQQLLFDGQVFVGLQARKTSIDYSNSNVEITKERVKATVLKVYYQIQAGRQQVATIDANITRFEKLFHDSKEYFKNGFVEKLDIDKADVSLTNLRTSKLHAENQIAVGLQALKMLLGVPVATQLVLKDSLPEQMFKEDIVDQVYNYNDRKEFQNLQLLEKLNNYNVRRYKLTYLPTVSANANYSRNAQRNEFNIFKTGEPWFRTTYIGFRIAVPIFDGFARDASVKSAKLQLQKVQNAIESLKTSIDGEVENARINMRSAIATMNEQKRNMALAESVYNQTNIKYTQGLGSNTEVTNAQAELSTAQNNYYASLFDAIIARIDYQRAIGKL